MWRGTNCSGLFDYAMQQAFQPDVDTVVFGAFWEEYLLGEYSVNKSRQSIYRAVDLTREPLKFDSPGTRIVLEQFQHIVSSLVSSGRRVFIVLSNPTSLLFDPVFPPEIRLALHVPRNFSLAPGPLVDAGPYEAYVAPLMNRLRSIAEQSGATAVDPRAALCAQMICPATAPDGMPLYIDSNHLGGSAARERASFIDQMLLGPDAPSSVTKPGTPSQGPLFEQ